MADGAFFIMALMLVVLLFSAAGVAAVVTVAAILARNSGTRAMGLRILLVGGIGILVTDLLVLIVRSNPSMLDRLPRAAQMFLTPFDWAFISPAPIFGFLTSSLFGFASAGGAAAVVALGLFLKRKTMAK